MILDAKRGDMGSTAEQYAREVFDRYGADAVTLSPFLGFDSIEPYLRHAGKGVILLCRTSNPGGADLQEQRLESGERLYERIARLAAGAWNTTGQVGLVVGATFPAEIARVRELAPRLPLLIPGIGAQGGDAAATVRAGWRGDGGSDHGADHRQLVARRALPGRRRGRRFRPRLAARRGGGTRRAGVGPGPRPRLIGNGGGASTESAASPAAVARLRAWSRSRPRCCSCAALGLLFEVGGLPARPALGLLALGAGVALVASALAVRVLGQRLRDAELLARRSRDALRLVADWYWEQDRDFRFTYISDAAAPARPGARSSAQLGRAPWELPNLGMSEAQLDRHRADLEAHRPFSGLIVRRRDPQGRTRLHSISGEPRYTPEGVFDGYRGVSRDVTDEIRAQRAFAASETRYRELFESSPSPIFLHRQGVVFDANPSAARLFGFADTEAMKGVRMADLHPSGESRQRVLDRIAELEQLPVGEGVPVRDFHARTVDGRPISVQATGVRVDAAGGPATLTIMFDITARLAAEAALRRSEAMLSQLFATSPDCIALYEADSGR